MSVGVENRLPLEPLHGLFGAQNWLAKRMALPEVLGEYLVDEIVGVILVHLDLFYDHTALAGDVSRIEDRVENQVAENVERNGQVLVKDLNVEADALLGGKCVHVAADGVDLAGNFFGAAVRGPFEDHVLNKMGDTVPLGVFITRSSLQPDADRSRADVLHLLGDDGHAVRQLLTADIADFLNHEYDLNRGQTTILT